MFVFLGLLPLSRYLPMVLLAGYTYEVSFIPGPGFPTYAPDFINVEYRDGDGCGQGLTLRFLGSSSGAQKEGRDRSLCCPGAP